MKILLLQSLLRQAVVLLNGVNNSIEKFPGHTSPGIFIDYSLEQTLKLLIYAVRPL